MGKHTFPTISLQILPLSHFLSSLLLDFSEIMLDIIYYNLLSLLYPHCFLSVLHSGQFYIYINIHFPAYWFFLQLCLVCYQTIYLLSIMLFSSKISIWFFFKYTTLSFSIFNTPVFAYSYLFKLEVVLLFNLSDNSNA